MPTLSQQPSPLSRAIMRRVYYVYVLRQVFSPFGMKVLIATALALVGTFLVSVPAVLQNALVHATPAELLSFFIAALTGTSLVVKVVAFGLTLCAGLMAYDIIRMARERKSSTLPTLHKISGA